MPRKKAASTPKTSKTLSQEPMSVKTHKDLAIDPITEQIQLELNNINTKYKQLEETLAKIKEHHCSTENNRDPTKIESLKEENSTLQKIIKLYNMLTCLYIEKDGNEYIGRVKKSKKDYFNFRLTKKKTCFLVKHENNNLDDTFFDNEIEFKPQFLVNYMAKIMDALTGTKENN